MKAIDITKSVIGLTSGIGATHIVGAIVKNNTEPENAMQTVTVFAGRVAIGMVVADIVRQHTDAKIDEIVAWWNKINTIEDEVKS